MTPLDNHQEKGEVFRGQSHHLRNDLLQQSVFLLELEIEYDQNGPALQNDCLLDLVPHVFVVDEPNELVEVVFLNQVHIFPHRFVVVSILYERVVQRE